jgi:radical SAM superfamily enzyme YgiQ (UPF0313 family)
MAFLNSATGASKDEIRKPLWRIWTRCRFRRGRFFPLKDTGPSATPTAPVGGKYLPLLTSRGCPSPCAFCVVPETSQGRWRKRSALNVVNEMAHWKKSLGVEEFHLEDLNPSLDEDRLREMARGLLERDLRVRWRIVAGMKLEPLRRKDTFDLLAASGCDYVSFSPESGSPRVLAAMKKSFPFDSALGIVKDLSRLGVRTQACFVLGFPGEEDRDRQETKTYVKKLARAGLDEAAFFVASPLPGSSLFETMEKPESLADLSFVPGGRGRGPRSSTLATPSLRQLSFDENDAISFARHRPKPSASFENVRHENGNGPVPGAVLVLVALAITRRGEGPW